MQGFNMGRYVPPDLEGVVSANQASGKRAPGTVRRNADGSTSQTVRFELPFSVWCGHCASPTLLGQGTRFNAVKTRVGSYHSTALWAFSIQHGACGGTIRVRTDPAHATYIVASGGTRRASPAPDDAELVAVDREQARADAFAALEVTIAEREVAGRSRSRVEELSALRGREGWDAPYEANRRLRNVFRAERKGREEAERRDAEVRGRLGGIAVELLPETEADREAARAVVFRRGSEGARRGRRRGVGEGEDGDGKGGEARTKGERRREEAVASLRDEVRGNTRPAMHVFGASPAPAGPAEVLGLKRKRRVEGPPGVEVSGAPEEKRAATALVGYGSDSD